MSSNPAFKERNIQKANDYLLDSRRSNNLWSRITFYRTCTCVHTLTSTPPIGSPIICMWSPADIYKQRERNLSFGPADVGGAGTRDEPLKTSALWAVHSGISWKEDAQARVLARLTSLAQIGKLARRLWTRPFSIFHFLIDEPSCQFVLVKSILFLMKMRK